MGSLWEARTEAEQQQLLALARVLKVPASVAKDTEGTLAQAAWDSMELDDESIVRVADVVFGTGWFALVHDHYDGDTLRTMQRRVEERKSAVPVPVAVRITLDTIEAMRKMAEAVQELGVAWESAAVDPGSLLICDDGRTRLLDGFVGGYVPSVPRMTKDSDTLAYAAPEMFEAGAVIDERTTVFRVAIIAWELLSSKRLLVGTKPVMQRRLQSPILRLDKVTRVGTKASEKLALVVERALSIDPGKRFNSLLEFERALTGACDVVGTQEDVIQFADALVGRESTLARLVMDRPQRLSDAMKSVRPTADVAKSFAAHVRGGSDATPKATEPDKPRSNKTPESKTALASNKGREAARIAPAPDAMFAAPLRALQPPRVPEPMRVEAATRTVQPRPLPVTATAGRALRLDPPDPARRTAPPPVPASLAMTTQAAVSAPALAPPRQRFKTLVGISAEEFRAGPPAPTAAAKQPEQAIHDFASEEPSSHVAALGSEANDDDSEGEFDEVDGDTWDDDVDDVPTQAYTVAQFANVASEMLPRSRMESGPRLASKPPPPEAPPAAHELADEPLPVDPGYDDSLEQERTMPAAQDSAPEPRLQAADQGPSTPGLARDMLAPAAVATATPAVPPEPARPAVAPRTDRKLLALALFFAGTTLVLGVVALGLFVRSQSAEHAASALAAAPLVELKAPPPAPAAAVEAPVEALPAPAAPKSAPAAEPDANAEPQANAPPGEAATQMEAGPEPAQEADHVEATRQVVAEPAKPSAAPVRKYRAPAAKPKKSNTSQRYVPSDI